MKAYTSGNLYDERDRYTGVREQMAQLRLDSEANLQVDITRFDARRRSGDVAEGSPDDGFRITDTHLLDPVLSLAGWTAVGLDLDDERVITPQLRLVRRDPDTLPHVVRTRGHTAVSRRMPGVDLLRLPVPLHPDAATYAAASIVMQVRFDRPPTDDEVVDVRAVAFDADGAEHDVGAVPAPEAAAAVQASVPWTTVTIPMAALAPLRRGAAGAETAVLTGWGLRGLPPRATVDVDALLAVDGALGEADLVVRGGDGSVAGAGRLFVDGLRIFLEHDWQYSLQPDLPDPLPLERPTPAADGSVGHHVIFADLSEEVVRGFSEPSVIERALGGEETAFRTKQLTQVRALAVPPGGSEALPSPTGNGRLTTNVPAGELPDRYPPEEPDPCRDRCLFTTNVTTGEGYRGTDNVHVRVEVLVAPTAAQPGVIGWSRDNAARVAPLVLDAAPGAESLFVAPEDARAFTAGGLVVVEDRRSRLDPDRPEHRAEVRALRTVNSATGELELEPAGWTLNTDPVPLVLGGALPRPFLLRDAAAVRRWDGVDHLLTGVRYNLVDGIDFALSGNDFRVLEHWTFVCRVTGPDSVAYGVVEQLTEAPVAGPRHERVPLARLTWTPAGREFTDLRARFLPLQDVRDRLIELGARKLAPGAFTVVVGDGVRTFGDIDQDLTEGVTGDEALQAALDRVGAAGGAIYVRAGEYRLEHPVLLQNRSMVRILGDGAASRLVVTGAGGAFHVDGCGADGELSIELLALIETPELVTPIGTEAARPLGSRPFGPIIAVPPPLPSRPLMIGDLVSSVPTVPDLVATLAGRLRDIGPTDGRAAGSVVATLTQLRRLQRADPGRPLKEVAPDELDVLRRLPHGVVTITDSNRVRLANLSLTSREHGQAAGTVAAAVLVSGSCSDVVVDGCRMLAPSGVVAAPYARSFTPAAVATWPRSGLFLHGLTLRDNVIEATGEASHGVRVADGVIDGVVVTGNRVAGFARGVALEDAAESRTGEAVDRTVLRDNVISASHTGVAVTGDGIEVDANEVRLGGGEVPAGAGVRAGVLVTGSSNRVRDNWITLDVRPAPALSVQAGVLVGTGVDDGTPVARPVHDVVVSGNRVDGAGALACGVLIGGATPCLDVFVQRNVLRALGDAGVRTWASSAPVGGVRVEHNAISDVARHYLSWGPSVVAEAGALAGNAQLPANGSPRDVLDVLLAQGAGAVAAVDAVLRWLERATLRGGIVLSLAEHSTVRDNDVTEIGLGSRPAGFVPFGAEIRTGGLAAVGTRELTVSGNRVRGVRSPVTIDRLALPAAGPVRPPVLDIMGGLVRPTRPGRVLDVFGPAVALRRQAMEYAAGNARDRQRIGRSIYGAIESLAGALEGGGPESRRLAVELQGGLTEMLEAQGTDAHTLAAHHVRATLSRAAALTAPDPAVAGAWDAAARFDAALVGQGADAQADAAVIQAAATDVLDGAPDLVAGLEGLGLDAEGDARTVLTGGGSNTQRAKARATLASTLGTLAEARASKVNLERVTIGAALSSTDRAAAEGLVQLSLATLETPDAGQLNEQAVERLAHGGVGLTEVLRSVNSPLADRVGTDIARLRAAGGQPTESDVQRLGATLRDVQAFARGEEVRPEVAVEDVEAQHDVFRSSLIAVTADQLERRVAALEVDPESTASRNLAVIEQATAQLGHLVGTDPQARATARAARAAVAAAMSDVDHRDEHRARARTLLRELAAGQGLPVAADTPATAPTQAPATRDATAPEAASALPIAGLGQLILALRDVDQPLEVRAEAGTLLDGRLRAAVEDAGIGPAEASELLGDVTTTIDGAVRGNATARAAAIGDLAARVETVAYRASQRSASPDAVAAYVLSGALARGLDSSLSDADRVAAIGAWTSARGEALSTSLAGQLSAATDVSGALDGVGRGLDGLLDIPPRLVAPTAVLSVAAETADGVFVSGATRRLDVTGNAVADCRMGISVLGPDAHVLAPELGPEPLVLTVHGNVVEGAALGALSVNVPSATAVLSSNAATGCCGALDRSAPRYGQAVVSAAGSGTLLVADNRLRDNGNTRSDAPVHEVLLDWDGDVTVRGNQVRHAGGSAGGHGVAVVLGEVPVDLVRRLAAAPALVVEPLNRTPIRPRPPRVLAGLEHLLSAGLTGIFDTSTESTASEGPAGIAVGGLALTTRELRPSYSVLTAGVRRVPETTLAESAADGWLAAATVEELPTTAFLTWLRVPRPPLIFLPPPVRRSVQVAGNDVVSAGPALAVLHEGQALVSATVVDNDLESLGPTGALYLRGVDTTVVSGNRLESQREVNVVVLRVRRSLVSISGNTIAGQEPAAPAPPPVPLDVTPLRPGFGDLHLTVPVGDRGSLMLRLDPEAVRVAIDEKRVSAFTAVAQEAETSFGLFARDADLTVNRDLASVLAGARRSGIVLHRVDDELVMRTLAHRVIPVVADADVDDAAEEPADATAIDPQVARAVLTSNNILSSARLSAPAKLFGLATSSGMPTHQARAFVQSQLLRAGGDEDSALASGLADITGIEELGGPTVRERVLANPVEDVVSLLLRNRKFTPIQPDRVLPPSPPPRLDPRQKSIVVVGGSRVAAVGNVTTAGIYVHDAAHSIENNL